MHRELRGLGGGSTTVVLPQPQPEILHLQLRLNPENQLEQFLNDLKQSHPERLAKINEWESLENKSAVSLVILLKEVVEGTDQEEKLKEMIKQTLPEAESYDTFVESIVILRNEYKTLSKERKKTEKELTEQFEDQKKALLELNQKRREETQKIHEKVDLLTKKAKEVSTTLKHTVKSTQELSEQIKQEEALFAQILRDTQQLMGQV